MLDFHTEKISTKLKILYKLQFLCRFLRKSNENIESMGKFLVTRLINIRLPLYHFSQISHNINAIRYFFLRLIPPNRKQIEKFGYKLIYYECVKYGSQNLFSHNTRCSRFSKKELYVANSTLSWNQWISEKYKTVQSLKLYFFQNRSLVQL